MTNHEDDCPARIGWDCDLECEAYQNREPVRSARDLQKVVLDLADEMDAEAASLRERSNQYFAKWKGGRHERDLADSTRCDVLAMVTTRWAVSLRRRVYDATEVPE